MIDTQPKPQAGCLPGVIVLLFLIAAIGAVSWALRPSEAERQERAVQSACMDMVVAEATRQNIVLSGEQIDAALNSCEGR